MNRVIKSEETKGSARLLGKEAFAKWNRKGDGNSRSRAFCKAVM